MWPEIRRAQRFGRGLGIGAIGFEWRLTKRFGLAFDVEADLRALPAEAMPLIGGFNRLRFTWYRGD